MPAKTNQSLFSKVAILVISFIIVGLMLIVVITNSHSFSLSAQDNQAKMNLIRQELSQMLLIIKKVQLKQQRLEYLSRQLDQVPADFLYQRMQILKEMKQAEGEIKHLLRQ